MKLRWFVESGDVRREVCRYTQLCSSINFMYVQTPRWSQSTYPTLLPSSATNSFERSATMALFRVSASALSPIAADLRLLSSRSSRPLSASGR